MAGRRMTTMLLLLILTMGVATASKPTTNSKFWSSLPGLRVSGGSRLRQAARRFRAYRQIRLPPPPAPEESSVSSSQEASQEPGVYATTASTNTNTAVLIQPPPPPLPTLHGDEKEEELSTISSTMAGTTSKVLVAPPPPPELTVVETRIAPPMPPTIAKTSSNSLLPTVYMGLLALQFGIQPLLVKRFTPMGVCKSSVVLVQECCKFVLAGLAYRWTTSSTCRRLDLSDLSIKSWLKVAGIPAGLYVIQNLCSLLAYQHLDGLTFNVLNQTKILSAALCCYLLLGKRQSLVQAGSLVLLLASALIMEQVLSLQSVLGAFRGGLGQWLSSSVGTTSMLSRRVTHGVVPVLLASLISGLAGALTQRNLQGSKQSRPKNSYLFSMELTGASALVLLASLLVTGDGKFIATHGLFHGWHSSKMMIPILTNSLGGLLVGLVTKHAGSVNKGFALIFGIFLSGLLQAKFTHTRVNAAQWVGGTLAATSLWLHAKHPSKPQPVPVAA